MAMLNVVSEAGFGWQVLKALGLVIASFTAYYLYRGYQVRSMFQRFQKQGLPMPPHSPIWGHLIVAGKLMADVPSDTHPDHLLVFIKQNWKTLFPGSSCCPPAIYLDTWPFARPMIVSLDPVVSTQFMDPSNHKLSEVHDFLRPWTHNLDLGSQEGAEWKLWRKRLSPGFSAASVTARIGSIIEEVEVFVEVLRGLAGKDGSWGEIFPLEDKAMNLTVDIIGRYILDVRLHDQSPTPSALKTALLDSVRRLVFYTNPFTIWTLMNPYRQFRFWVNNRTMERFLTPIIESRLTSGPSTSKSGKNQFLNLTVQTLHDEEGGLANVDKRSFIAIAIAHIKFFLFAGHDTSATTLCWAFHYLSTNPSSMTKLRAELAAVLGPDPSSASAAATLRRSPHLLNSLVYANAVVKETLRLQTNVGSFRLGAPGLVLVGPEYAGEYAGMRFPAGGMAIWEGNWAIHRDPALWPRVDEFVPERWLVMDPGDPMCPPKNGMRAFELGPRDCIGQHLATVEMKLVFALVVREFEVKEDWEGWDLKRGVKGKKPDMVLGKRCYQISLGGDSPPHHKDGLPVRVRLRTGKET